MEPILSSISFSKGRLDTSLAGDSVQDSFRVQFFKEYDEKLEAMKEMYEKYRNDEGFI